MHRTKAKNRHTKKLRTTLLSEKKNSAHKLAKLVVFSSRLNCWKSHKRDNSVTFLVTSKPVSLQCVKSILSDMATITPTSNTVSGRSRDTNCSQRTATRSGTFRLIYIPENLGRGHKRNAMTQKLLATMARLTCRNIISRLHTTSCVLLQ